MLYLRLKNIASVILLGMVFLSCQQTTPNSSEDTLARVGSEYLTVQQAVEQIPDFVLKEDSTGALERYREDWIRQQLVLQEANRLGLSDKKEVIQKIRQAREEILRHALKDYVIGSAQKEIEVTDEEAHSYYQANKNQFVLNEDFVQFRYMRTKTLNAARAARQDLLGGVPWPEVAREYAIDPDVTLNESKQYWPISMAAKDVDIMHRYLNIIGQSEISPIQRRNGVYQFVQLMDRRAKGKHPDLDWLMEQIKDWMVLNKRRRNFSSYVKNLYLKAKSNNEVETFNVLPTKSNQKNTVQDTLENNSANE